MNFFTKHPHERGMTYSTHLLHATKLGLIMAKGCSGVLIHALFPCWFQTIATDTSEKLNQCLRNTSNS